MPAFDHYGGYHFGDNSVVAFSHTHLVGAGVGDLGNFGVMPFFFPSAATEPELARLVSPSGHAAPLDHALEVATPGFYSVGFAGLATAELVAAGTHAGSHRYTYPGKPAAAAAAAAATAASDSCGVLVDVCHTALGNGEQHHTCRCSGLGLDFDRGLQPFVRPLDAPRGSSWLHAHRGAS